MNLARISHKPAAVADMTAVTGRAPRGRLDLESTTPAPPLGCCDPPHRHLDALATINDEKWKLIRITSWLLCCCLLLALSGCGNKGPLVLPEEEEKKTKSENS